MVFSPDSFATTEGEKKQLSFSVPPRYFLQMLPRAPLDAARFTKHEKLRERGIMVVLGFLKWWC